MAQKTLLQMLQDMAVHLNGDTEAPDTGSDEYNLWVSALNQAQEDWAGSDFDFESLRNTYRITLTNSGTSLALPGDFVKFSGFPTIDGDEYEEINPQEEFRYTSDSKYVVPNIFDKSIKVNPGYSDNSYVEIPYRFRPTSLATLTAQSPCPSDNFLIAKATEIIMFSRENAKYQKFQEDADIALAKMIGTEVNKGSQKDTSIKNTALRNSGFVIGRD